MSDEDTIYSVVQEKQHNSAVLPFGEHLLGVKCILYIMSFKSELPMCPWITTLLPIIYCIQGNQNHLPKA